MIPPRGRLMPIFVPLLAIAVICALGGWGTLALWLAVISIAGFNITARAWPEANWIAVDPEKISGREGAILVLVTAAGFAAAWALSLLAAGYLESFFRAIFSPIFAWIFGGRSSP
jgi:hypothetical protein